MGSILPLYHFFVSLTQHEDFSLGIGEYQALLTVLMHDNEFKYFEVPEEDKEASLLKLCKLLWLKPNQNKALFEKMFYRSFAYIEDVVDKEPVVNEELNIDSTPIGSQDVKPPIVNPHISTQKKIDFTKPEGVNPLEKINDEITETLYLNLEEKGDLEAVITKAQENDKEIQFIRDYTPFKSRNIIQLGRGLRKKNSRGTPTNIIDIQNTAREIVRNGYVVAPIYQRERLNDASVVILIDNKGSMVAFKHWAAAMAAALKDSIGLRCSIYYFHNIPLRYNTETNEKGGYYVYENLGHTRHTSIDSIFSIQPNSPVLIISDAGATAGKFNMTRIEHTADFLSDIYRRTLNVAWLNPMPEDRWDSTSVFLLRDMVDMFEANEAGFGKAIQILKGQRTPSSVLLC